MYFTLKLSFGFLLFTIIVKINADDNASSISPSEAQAIQKLRPLVIKHLYKDYMKEDIFLVRFLRSRDLNIEDTKDSILQLVNWRKQNKIDNILEETLDLEKTYPYLITRDRDERPVGIIKVGQWKVRRGIISGRYAELSRYIQKLFEIASKIVREDSGKNVTQGNLLLDFSGFTIRENACFQCTRLNLEIFGIYEKYYPQSIHKIVLVNVPRIFLSVWEVLKPALSQYTRDSISIYGYDKNEWRSVILKLMADEQIPDFLGGKYKS